MPFPFSHRSRDLVQAERNYIAEALLLYRSQADGDPVDTDTSLDGTVKNGVPVVVIVVEGYPVDMGRIGNRISITGQDMNTSGYACSCE